MIDANMEMFLDFLGLSNITIVDGAESLHEIRGRVIQMIQESLWDCDLESLVALTNDLPPENRDRVIEKLNSVIGEPIPLEELHRLIDDEHATHYAIHGFYGDGNNFCDVVEGCIHTGLLEELIPIFVPYYEKKFRLRLLWNR